ncbi:hypothetical protein BD779DRAFT_1500322 [Infundibulicybe gibba]|nr:hypothetical protein BD779DRAFT_1500322 [Infundibulicybe gibba]
MEHHSPLSAISLSIEANYPTELRDSCSAVPFQDAEYYIPDGNVVLRIRNTLFKVHRSMLIKDHSAFEGMFSLDKHSGQSDGSPPEGETDEDPIYLQGDTPEEFRALLWSLYALPAEVVAAMTPQDPQGDKRLIQLARMANKYHFKTTEMWSLNALTSYHGSYPASAVLIDSLMDTTELAALCNFQPLLEVCKAKWKLLISHNKYLAHAINIAERLDMRVMLGLAYNAMMLMGRPEWESEPMLNRNQRIRLLSGYYNLSQLCETLSTTPPRLVHNASCTQRRTCKQGWNDTWSWVTSAAFYDQHRNLSVPGGATFPSLPQPPDLFKRILLAEGVIKTIVEGMVPELRVSEMMNNECLEAALGATQEKVKELRENLADYFSDVV